MKLPTTLFILCFCIAACKKETVSTDKATGYIARVKTALKDSIEATLFNKLDFEKALLSEVDSIDLYVVRIPFLHQKDSARFVLVKAGKNGAVVEGKLISLIRTPDANRCRFEGQIELYSLQEELMVASVITKGYIAAFHSVPRLTSGNIVSLVQPIQPAAPAATELPEVIVVASYPPRGGISYSEWLNIQSMFGNGAGNYYTPITNAGGTGYSTGGSGTTIPPLEVEREYVYTLPGINIEKIFRCFDYVPSGGASYTIKLCADLPLNNQPYASTNYSSVSGGHTFLVITKSNGGTSVTQSFGFYPRTEPSWYNPLLPITSSLKSNGLQEINASIEMNINESQFKVIKQHAIAWATRNYELADYNCTNYALDIFNSVRAKPIIVPPYKVILSNSVDPYNMGAEPVAVFIEKAPQTLFGKLQELKSGNNPEAARIVINQSHSYHAPASKGECN